MLKDIVRRFIEKHTQDNGVVTVLHWRELSCGHKVLEASGGKAKQALMAQCKRCDTAARWQQGKAEVS